MLGVISCENEYGGMENQYHIVLGNGHKVSPYVNGQEGVASGQGGHHGGSEAGDLSIWSLHIDFSTRGVLGPLPKKVSCQKS